MQLGLTMSHWLMKSEPAEFSLEDLKQAPSSWEGVRNYQARNFMQQMQANDLVFFYHSSCQPPGIAGIAKVIKTAYPDSSCWDPKSQYYDPKSTVEQPRWFMVDIEFVSEFSSLLTLSSIKGNPQIKHLPLVKPGNRLSVMPVSPTEWQAILDMVR